MLRQAITVTTGLPRSSRRPASLLQERGDRPGGGEEPDLVGEHDQVEAVFGARRQRLQRGRLQQHRLRHAIEEAPEGPGKRIRLKRAQDFLNQLDVGRAGERRNQPARDARELSRLRKMHDQNALHFSLAPRPARAAAPPCKNASMAEPLRRAPRFYIDAPLRAGGSCILPEDTAHHAIHVMRLREQDEAILFNGRGGEYAARVASIQRLRIALDVLQHRQVERESPLRIALVQGVSSGDRMDFTVRKAVELGVAAIHPVLATRSVARPKGERADNRARSLAEGRDLRVRAMRPQPHS